MHDQIKYYWLCSFLASLQLQVRVETQVGNKRVDIYTAQDGLLKTETLVASDSPDFDYYDNFQAGLTCFSGIFTFHFSRE